MAWKKGRIVYVEKGANSWKTSTPGSTPDEIPDWRMGIFLGAHPTLKHLVIVEFDYDIRLVHRDTVREKKRGEKKHP